MDKKLFLEEIHTYIDNSYQEFEKYQQIVFNILEEFDRICQSNDITYWLAFGNLIGAVRDHSQLPWDYDVDVLCPVDEREKLISVLNKQLGNKFSFAYKNNTPHYPSVCLRVYNKDFSWTALHVDVFFLIGAPSVEKEQNKLIRLAKKYRRIRNRKNCIFHFPGKQTFVGRLRDLYQKILYFYISNNQLDKKEEKMMFKYPINKSDFVMPYGGIKTFVYPKSYFETIMCGVNESTFPIPKEYDYFLTPIYGNWKAYLPIKKRFEEFYKMKIIVDSRVLAK